MGIECSPVEIKYKENLRILSLTIPLFEGRRMHLPLLMLLMLLLWLKLKGVSPQMTWRVV